MKILRIKCDNIATLLQKHGLQEIQKIIVNVFLKFIRDYDRAFLTSILSCQRQIRTKCEK